MPALLHIHRPLSTRFQARVRGPGRRKYTLIGKPTKSIEVAIMRMAREFATDRYWKRGDVLMTADYYDPSQCCEITR